MAHNSSINLDPIVNADGYSIGGGTTKRTFTLSGADYSLSFSAVASGQVVYYNGSNWINSATPTITSISLTSVSNQLTLGGATTTTISATAPASSAVYTIPDVGTTANFVMTSGNQSIAGIKTFTDHISVGNPIYSDNNLLQVGTTYTDNVSKYTQYGSTTISPSSTYGSNITYSALFNQLVYNSSSDGGTGATYAIFRGVDTTVQVALGSNATNTLEGYRSQAIVNASSITQANIDGYRSYITLDNASGADSSTISLATHFTTQTQLYQANGTMTQLIHYAIVAPSVVNGTFTYQYGIKIDSLTQASSNYGIFFTGTAAGDGIFWGTGSKIYSNGTQLGTTASWQIYPATNQLVLGGTASGRTVTITAPQPATSSRTHTVPDIVANGTFVLSSGALTSTRVPYANSNAALIDSASMTFDTTHGLILAAGSTSAMQFSSTTGTSVGGILFGTDVNLYRRATGQLTTDNNLIAGDATIGPIYAPDTQKIEAQSGNIHAWNAATLGSELNSTANATSDPNGNESSATTGWSQTGMTTITADTGSPEAGTYCIKGTNSTTTSGRVEFSWSPVIGKMYKISVWVKGSATTGRIQTWTGLGTTPQINTISTGWTNYVFYQVATATSSLLRFYANNSGTGSDIYVDNLSIKEVLGGDIQARGKFTGGGTSGIKVAVNGAVTSDGAITVSATSAQLALTTSSQVLTISCPTIATSSRTYTIPDAGANANFIVSPDSPSQGDIVYYSGTQWKSLVAGTSGYFLKTQGVSSNPIWAQPSTSSLSDILFTGQSAPTAKPAAPAINTSYTSPTAAQVLSTNLVFDIPLTEGSGISVTDKSTSGWNSSGFGATPATWATTTGLNTPYLHFVTSPATTPVQFANNPQFNYNSPFTVCIRYRCTGSTSTMYGLINKMDPSTALGWEIWFNSDNTLGMQMFKDGTYYFTAMVSGVGRDSNWHLLVITYSGSGLGSGVAMWLDGVSKSLGVTGGGMGTSSILNSANLMIGSRYNGTSPLAGDIAYVAIWSRVLQTVEVTDLSTNPYLLEGASLSVIDGSLVYYKSADAKYEITNTPYVSTITLNATTSQLVLGATGHITTITCPAPAAAARIYTIPDTAADCSFVMTALAQTIAGVKTFSSGIAVTATSNHFVLSTATNTATITAATQASARIYTIPDTAADCSFVMTALAQTVAGVKTFSSALTCSLTTNQLVLGTTRTITITAPTPATSSRTHTIPDILAAGTFALSAATIDLTAQTAAINTTTLYTTPGAAGMYIISYYAKVTTAATTSTLGALTIGYTDVDSTTPTFVSATNTGNTTTSTIQGTIAIYAKASTNITYAMAYTSSPATTMAYNLHIKVTAV